MCNFLQSWNVVVNDVLAFCAEVEKSNPNIPIVIGGHAFGMFCDAWNSQWRYSSMGVNLQVRTLLWLVHCGNRAFSTAWLTFVCLDYVSFLGDLDFRLLSVDLVSSTPS